MTTPQNAITQRIDLLSNYWQQFTENEEAQIVLWLIEPDEFQLIELFVEVEESEHGSFPDLFIKCETPFEEVETYGHLLTQDLHQYFEARKEELAENGIQIPWNEIELETASSHTFLEALALIKKHIPDLTGNLIAYFSPSDCNNILAWSEWFVQLLEIGIPERVKLMLIDVLDQNLFARVFEQYAEKVHIIQPALNIPAAMRQLASSGNPSDPSVQFRKIFVDLGQAANRNHLSEVRRLGKQALQIARTNGWLPMQVTIYMLVGSVLANAGENTEALENYEKSIQLTQPGYKQGDKESGNLLLQSLFGKASAFISMQNLESAAETYAFAVEVADSITDYFNMMEASRMTAYCYEHQKEKEIEKAWTFGLKGLENARKLKEEIRVNSTLPYLGERMLRIARKMDDEDKMNWVYDNMVELMGKDWEDKLETQPIETK